MLRCRAARGYSRAARTLPRACPPRHRARRGGLIAGRAAPPAPPEAARTPPPRASLEAPADGSRVPLAPRFGSSRRPTPRLSEARLERVSSRLVSGTLSARPGFEPCVAYQTQLSSLPRPRRRRRARRWRPPRTRRCGRAQYTDTVHIQWVGGRWRSSPLSAACSGAGARRARG
eukprot:scaffold760_cov63-Phaeocystis_antarctica.AAC.1